MHLVFFHQKGNKTKLEALQMVTQYEQYYVQYPLSYTHFNTYLMQKKKSFM